MIHRVELAKNSSHGVEEGTLERIEELRKLSEEAEAEGKPFLARLYQSMIEGLLKLLG